ncbi:MAG: glycosyltransferase family 39 protein [bacterium]|nr:glycosyltransferase family 39 protein [bacterium]
MIENFLKKYYSEIIFCLLLTGIVIVSLPALTTKPRLWYDEGINIEFAKNFLDFGKLDTSVAPGEFSGLTRFYQASGYPLSLPLSIFFSIFGFGSVQARAYMLCWIAIALTSIFIFVKKMAGKEAALAASILIATFASFHDNGRTVMGEIPGFVFLLWALYWIFWKNSYFISGLLFGLAISAKPSVYISALPAILILLILERDNFWKNGLKIFAGMLPLFLLRIWFVMPNIFSLADWQGVINLFQNPFGANISPAVNFLANFSAIPRTYTIIYFGLFTAIILFDYFRRNPKDFIYKKFFWFAIIYNFFAFLYYLKSPGWLRYLIAADLLTFILLVLALRNLLLESIKKKILFYLIIFGLISFQTYYLFTSAKIFYSDSEEVVISLVNTEFKNNTIGIFNVPEIGAFVPAERKYQTYRMLGVPFIGKNPIFYNPFPKFFILRSGEETSHFLSGEKEILLKNYQLLQIVGHYSIYKRIVD